MQAHCSSLPENLSYLQEKFDLELETKESADPKEAEKNWEKIKTAVVSELAGNYEFVREPEAVPEGKDFVEWFLKESKKGNSVHFAAAATMLLRACGCRHDMWWAMQRRQVSFRDRRTAAIRLFWRMITPMPGQRSTGKASDGP